MFTAMPQAITPEAINSFFALAFGFAVAGFCATGYRLFAERFPELSPARSRPGGGALCRRAAADVLGALHHHAQHACAAAGIERRRVEFVMMATVIAGLWSLMSGTVVVLALQRCSRSDIRLASARERGNLRPRGA